MSAASYLDQHEDLIKTAQAIVEAVEENTPSSIRQVVRLRLMLSRSVLEHVAAETALVRRHAHGCDDERSVRLLKKFRDDVIAWHRRLVDCTMRWSSTAVMADPLGFLAEYRPLCRALEDRVCWEEDVFYPAFLPDMIRHRNVAATR